MKGALLILSIIGAVSNDINSIAHAQVRSPPCSIACPPDMRLDRDKCTCEPRPRSNRCMLVCLDPDETLDADKCRCVAAR